VRGTVSEGQANVTVNGKPAAVSNRSYQVDNIELIEGTNTLTVQGADQVGKRDHGAQHGDLQGAGCKHIELTAGQGQRAKIRATLGQSLKVKLLDELGNPAANKPVVFRVTEGDGVLAPGQSDASQAVIRSTDGSGFATTSLQVGSRAGNGNNHVTAKAVGFDGQIEFLASADPNPGNKVSVTRGTTSEARRASRCRCRSWWW